MPKDPALVCHVRSLFPKQSSCCLSVVWVPGLGTCTSRACCHGVVLIAHESPLPFFAADRIPASQLWEKRVKQGICNAKRSHPCQGLGRGLSFRQGALKIARSGPGGPGPLGRSCTNLPNPAVPVPGSERRCCCNAGWSWSKELRVCQSEKEKNGSASQQARAAS